MAECQCGQPKHEDESLCDDCTLLRCRKAFAEGVADILPSFIRKDTKLSRGRVRSLAAILQEA